MKNQNEQIANIQLHISEDCTKTEKQIIDSYWKLLDNEFVNSPRWIKSEFHIDQTGLTLIISTHSTLTLYLLCENCTSYELHNATSQSSFKQIKNLHRSRYSDNFECRHCIEEQRKQHNLEEQRKNEELNQKLNNAIENKNWKNLSTFEKKLLKNCLEMNFNVLKKHYGSILGKTHYKNFIIALENIENQNLLALERNLRNNYITNYKYLNKLKEYKQEIIFIEKKTESTVEFNNESNQIRFKLTINEFQNHPDSPLYAGTVTFKEKIVIEPNVEYTFGQWKRANDHLYLTLMPTENLKRLPQQKRISKLPISTQKDVTEFLNNIGENLDF